MAVPEHGILAGQLEATRVLLPHVMGNISENAAVALLISDKATALLVGPGFNRS
jgi:hypothetical protein